MRYVLISFICLWGICLNAQKDTSDRVVKKNSFFLEFGGNAAEHNTRFRMRFSLNYDRILFSGRLIQTSARIGYTIPAQGYNVHIPYNRSEHIIPVMLNLLIGKNDFHVEIGAGVAIIFFNDNRGKAYYAFTSVLGIRYQPHAGGFLARAGLTPTYGPVSGSRYPYLGCLLGLSIGYSF